MRHEMEGIFSILYIPLIWSKFMTSLSIRKTR